MSLFIKKGMDYLVTSKAAMDVHEVLPVGNYIVRVNPQTEELFLTQVGEFPDPGRIYGAMTNTVGRVMATYQDRPSSTGILLAGEKGSGKSLMAKEIARLGAAQGIPTIIISEPWCGETFNDFLQNITQDCIVLFDELEKVYTKDKQTELLTLFDGVFPTKKLFIITVNDQYSLSNYLMNRPGRIYYFLSFKGLSKEEVREYIDATLLNKENGAGIETVASMFAEFNFDLLKAMVEEMNRYSETALEVLKYLNARPMDEMGVKYAIRFQIKGVENDEYYPREFRGTPFGADGFAIRYEPGSEDEDGESDSMLISMKLTDLVSVNSNKGEIIFVKEDYKIILTRVVPSDKDMETMYKLFSAPLTA